MSAVTVTVELALVPAWTSVGEVAAIEKSLTVKTADVEWDSAPLVPVIVRV